MAHSPKPRHAPSARKDKASYAELLGLRAATPLALVREVARGFPYATITSLRRATGLSSRELADAIDIRMRTVARRKVSGRLEPEESDRVLRLARVFAMAVSFFGGDVPKARRWFTTPLPVFGGQSALELAATDAGAHEVEVLIWRVEHGVLT